MKISFIKGLIVGVFCTPIIFGFADILAVVYGIDSGKPKHEIILAAIVFTALTIGSYKLSLLLAKKCWKYLK